MFKGWFSYLFKKEIKEIKYIVGEANFAFRECLQVKLETEKIKNEVQDLIDSYEKVVRLALDTANEAKIGIEVINKTTHKVEYVPADVGKQIEDGLKLKGEDGLLDSLKEIMNFNKQSESDFDEDF